MSQEVNSRKHVQLMTSQVAKKDTQVKHETFYSHKFSKRLADQNRREHEDHLKHFQVSTGQHRPPRCRRHDTPVAVVFLTSLQLTLSMQ